MAGLGNTYISIDGNNLPETSSFSIEPQYIEKVFQTESGNDVIISIRSSKVKMACSWERLPAATKDLCVGFCSSPSVTVTFDSSTYLMRARNIKMELIRYSNRYSGSKGLWNVSFDLEEF